MARGSDWTAAEVEVIVADYCDMLLREVRGERFNKAARNRALAASLNGRSRGSIEFKHQNITAVLHALGYPGIDGYKPMHRYQALLRDVVEQRIRADDVLRHAIEAQVEAPAGSQSLTADGLLVESAPHAHQPGLYVAEDRKRAARSPRKAVDFLGREARNRSLGLAGELLVVKFEKARLARAGCVTCARDVDHVSVTKGDGLGYDIHSFEVDGRRRLIEVKTTAYGRDTPFFVSRNEEVTSRELAESYHLYRVFRMRTAPRMFMVSGSLAETFRLVSELYSARVA